MDATSEHLCMLLEDRFIRRVATQVGADPDRYEVVPLFNAPDLQIEGLGLSLLSEMETGGLGGELYSESMANMLAQQTQRQHSSLGRRSRQGIGHEAERSEGLSRRSLALATDYINDNLPRKLTLEEIAGAATMSPYHFARSFKTDTGLSPHQYVIHRRVERARSLLADTNLTTSEIASAVGFSSQSHLASHFKGLLGVSTSALRRESTR